MENLATLIKEDAVLGAMARKETTWWFNPPVPNTKEELSKSEIPAELVQLARERFKRFAPWMMKHYPESVPTGGILESPLQHAGATVAAMNKKLGSELKGNLWFKRDDSLPVSGSIKARGGIHEVLEVAENIALAAGVLTLEDDYTKFDDQQVREVLAGHGISVGSTGNLGLSIGLVAAELGFVTTVHMSADARAWKKDLLRSNGVNVVEYPGDFSEAVTAGRIAAEADPNIHFVDDEESLSLLSGYAVAAGRLAGQLQSLEVKVDEDHPLFVYLPCGVGGSPGGITYGLKQIFGEAVHCIYIEPTGAPAMTLGVRTGLHDAVSANDLGLDGKTVADGLAVSRPSRLVGQALGKFIDGFATLHDEQMMAQVALLFESEGIRIEPSATAGLSVAWRVEGDTEFLRSRILTSESLKNASHIVWFTGGSMVPEAEMQQYIDDGSALLTSTPFN